MDVGYYYEGSVAIGVSPVGNPAIQLMVSTGFVYRSQHVRGNAGSLSSFHA